jgi:uncharacterized protein
MPIAIDPARTELISAGGVNSRAAAPHRAALHRAHPMIYLDTAAVAKLIAAQPETESLRTCLHAHSEDRRFTCVLTRVELERDLPAGAGESIHTAIAALDTVTLSDRFLDAATRVPRTATVLDALHIVAAQTAGERLAAFITYTSGRAAAARAAKLPITQPGLPETP